ncbi:Co2+/Mg2+ efflux protein ApaG [Asticcacaulis sp. ZE23SCel15]|uniref:Co2+/Mg2+ efflux protein ApaG n=1 Tax=Asticcacaulis sp. ZE23SCel15 TaxID=3059027 RepID=UPI00265D6E42|nr:Co2+/Mg2+ efflux protein ApaG [Asticcacaulis sp. ZE23SCel15]WKL57759.1 Co2+/Mg2+ efflux protein ApaG [Asticcacaulis sp. ZE23SCel15]
MIYEAVSQGIRISVEVEYIPPEDDLPATSRRQRAYVWAYHIIIDNERGDRVQLKTRHWTIMDGLGRIEIVEGDGVVGQQPILEPQESYSYSSGCPLPTPSGSMSGYYMFEDENGKPLKVTIPTFSLDLPEARRVLN